MAGQESLLLLLPDPCLLKVLQCCAADDQHSLFSAARAHSRLHEAAVAALSSIAMVIFSPQQLDSVLLYLGKHCRQIDSIDLDAKGDGVFVLHQLPADLQLSTLQLEDFHLQLQPCGGFQGVLGAAVEIAALTQLRLGNCSLLDGEEELAAALAQLPAGLQHLSIDGLWIDDDHPASFPSAVLTPLNMLTHLELADVRPTCSDPDGHFLQPLQAMTRLVHLRLSTDPPAHTFPASVVSGSLSLTFLTLSSCEIEPEILAGKTSLRHVSLSSCSVLGGAPGVRQLLAHLQELQELTQLFMASRFQEIHEDIPPATAFSALTASSKLQHLDLNGCTLPSGVWQHIFPANRQLPHLTSLDINGAGPSGRAAVAPDGSRLVTCCPGLQLLDMRALLCGAQQLAPLCGLSGLHTLSLGDILQCTEEDLEPVCQLTGLRELVIECCESRGTRERLLLQLTQLKQLTYLEYSGDLTAETVLLVVEGPDLPVWRQIRSLYI